MGFAEWPVVGRDEELAIILAQLQERGRSVVIGGSPGVGKTRLAREALALAGGEHVRSVTATRSAASTPLGALLGVVDGAEPADGADRSAAVRGIRQELRQGVPEDAVPLLGVDDGHLLDDMSAAFLLQLAQQGDVRLVVTVRTGEEMPDALTALWRDEIAERVELQALGRDDVQGLLREALPGADDEGTAHRVWSTTGGNPLYLRELAREALAVGDLRLVGRRWSWDGRRVPVGVRLRELLAKSFADLADDRRLVLELLALGEPLAADALIEEAGADAVDACERRGLVVVASSGPAPMLRLHHPMLGELLRADLTVAGHRERSARLIEMSTRATVDPLRVATWHVDAGHDAPPELLTDAATMALRRFDMPLAGRLASAAIAAGGGAEATLVLARARYAESRYDEVEALLAPLEASLEDEAELVAVARLLCDVRFLGLDRPADADAALARVGERVVDPTLRLHVEALRASIRNDSGDIDGALELTVWATDPDVDVLARLQAITSAASSLTHSGRPAEALALCDDLLPVALARAEENPRDVGRVLGQRVHALVALGRLDEAQEIIEFIHGIAAGDGDDEVQGGTAMVLGQLCLERGEITVAREWLDEAATVLGRFDPQRYLPWCHGLQAAASALAGDPEAAEAAATRAEEQAALASVHVFEVHVDLARAHATAAAGGLTRAGELAVEAADRAESRGALFSTAVALNAAIDFEAPPSPIADRLAGLAAVTASPWIDLFSDHARAVAAADGEALEQAAERLAELGANLRAARTYERAADAHGREGRRSSATRAAGLAAQLFARCEGAVRTGTATPMVKLTRREQEITTLAVRGLTNQAIASQLGVGVRTVEGHLLRATTKLGVSGRGELAAVLGSPTESA